MRIIILALLVVALASQFTPNWSNCGDGDSWSTTTVTLAEAPARGQNNTISVCGQSADDFTIQFYNIAVSVFGVTVANKTTTHPQNTSIIAGAQHCFDYNFTIPTYAVGSISVDLTLVDPTGAGRGCVELDCSP